MPKALTINTKVSLPAEFKETITKANEILREAEKQVAELVLQARISVAKQASEATFTVVKDFRKSALQFLMEIFKNFHDTHQFFPNIINTLGEEVVMVTQVSQRISKFQGKAKADAAAAEKLAEDAQLDADLGNSALTVKEIIKREIPTAIKKALNEKKSGENQTVKTKNQESKNTTKKTPKKSTSKKSTKDKKDKKDKKAGPPDSSSSSSSSSMQQQPAGRGRGRGSGRGKGQGRGRGKSRGRGK